MSAHTPGPWSVVDGYYPSFREIHGPSFKISIVMSALDLGIEDAIRREADAQLIAAAPDLLEALKRCKFDSLNMSLDDLAFCRAAIQKAEGAKP